MRSLIQTFLIVLTTCAAVAQDAPSNANPFEVSDDSTVVDREWKATHPDGENPHERMLSLVHTDALPRFDRVELYAVSLPDPKGAEPPKKQPTDKTFPVRPYRVHADIHGHVTLQGNACGTLRTAWQSLAFDRLGGAFCHYPAYGFRLYRDDILLFETTVCWKCQNFYVPRYDPEKRGYTYGWYGFGNDDKAQALLKLFRSHLPHPKLQ